MKEEFLDHGFVELVDMMGDDYRILQSARVSTGGQAKKGEKQDRGLIRYLYKNNHSSPLEQVVFTFHAKVPNFVMKQFLRHRTTSANEASQRYSPIINDFYVPDEWRIQGETNHQGSGDSFNSEMNEMIGNSYTTSVASNFKMYDNMLKIGVAKEMARMIIPSSVYTEFYFTVNFRNLLHMLELRLHEHAQYEIRVFAEAIDKILTEMDSIKWTMEIFHEMTELNWELQRTLNRKVDTKKIVELLKEM